MFWHTYEYGFKTRAAAQEALHNEIAEGRLSAKDCKIEAYQNTQGARRWQIKELAPA